MLCAACSRKTLPHTVTNGSGPTAATQQPATSKETVKPSLALQRNVKQSAEVSSVNRHNTDASQTVSRRSSFVSSSRTLSRRQPFTSSNSNSTSLSQDKVMNQEDGVMKQHGRKLTQQGAGGMLNQRRSVTSQFLKSATDRRLTAHLPAAMARPQTAYGRRKSYQAQLIVKQKTTQQVSNIQPMAKQKTTQQSCHNSNKKAGVETHELQSCRDRRKSYQAELVARQKAIKRPTPCRSNITPAWNGKVASSSQRTRMSTPATGRHSAASTTPFLSCIARHKTVSFVTPASRKSTPQLHRTQPVQKEMSMRSVSSRHTLLVM